LRRKDWSGDDDVFLLCSVAGGADGAVGTMDDRNGYPRTRLLGFADVANGRRREHDELRRYFHGRSRRDANWNRVDGRLRRQFDGRLRRQFDGRLRR
jgi:hypothetical protein